MISRLGLYCAITVLMKCLPKLPVPPVTSTVLSLRSIQGCEKSRRRRRCGRRRGAWRGNG